MSMLFVGGGRGRGFKIFCQRGERGVRKFSTYFVCVCGGGGQVE